MKIKTERCVKVKICLIFRTFLQKFLYILVVK